MFTLTRANTKNHRDEFSRHVSEADEAVCIGRIASEEVNPFLNIKLLIDTALSVGAQAIHPGYGYLSENASFADAVRQAGLIFIGPSSEAMSTLGDKRTSKEYLALHAAEVPLIPGFSGSSQDAAELASAAERIGYPVMLKASAGGGGKGMRVVREAAQLGSELERAQSEAKRSFGSSDCILEKYIAEAKHVEIQIMGDQHGVVISLGERDCSIQRRHQKVIEETPCLWLTADLRQRMSRAAVRIGELMAYEGAGTVEFVVDVVEAKFYFLEVNCRLQVEHPVTEEVTGFDLVSLQLYVAAGGRLADVPNLSTLKPRGHAIECRLCAEDPNRDFFPEHGTIRLWQPTYSQAVADRIRYETAVQTGSEISIYFDSMIAKLVVWAPSRSEAVEKMVKVLQKLVCIGVRTNQLFLQSCLLHRDFQDPAYTTSFIPQRLDTLLRNPHPSSSSVELDTTLGIIPCLFTRLQRQNTRTATGPFRNIRQGFRNQRLDPVGVQSDILCRHTSQQSPAQGEAQQPLICVWTDLRDDSYTAHLVALSVPPTTQDSDSAKPITSAGKITASYNSFSNAIRSGTYKSTPDHTITVNSIETQQQRNKTTSWTTSTLDISINGARHTAFLCTTAPPSPTIDTATPTTLLFHHNALGSWTSSSVFSPLAYFESLRSTDVAVGISSRQIKAPMPCKVLQVLKKAGEEVKVGEAVIVIESMKMEISVAATAEGKFVCELAVGDTVDEGVVLCVVE